ncbi:ribosomal protein L11 [Acrasis kona]|uniref:Ribosomal protein L11 n=1 Tax=Acrasis kona TaxID=1008807 RepID=A0AAW2ZGY8_9EUKA
MLRTNYVMRQICPIRFFSITKPQLQKPAGKPAASSAPTPGAVKVLAAKVQLRIPACQATTKEPVGPALGQYGIPAGDFCTRFNTASEKFIAGSKIDCKLLYYKDKKYDIVLDPPDISRFVIKACQIKKGASKAKKVAEIDPHYPVINSRMLYEVVNYVFSLRGEKVEFNHFKMARDSLRAMGIYFENEKAAGTSDVVKYE